MPSISVVVFKQGMALSGATVQLNGRGVIRKAKSNAAGAAVFAGLNPGSYVVNASKGATYLGAGHLKVSTSNGVLHIRYPSRPARNTKGTVKVGMTSGKKGASTFSVNMKSAGNAYSRRSTFGGSVKFIYVEPGTYQVTGTAEFQAGETRSGNATVAVVPGGFHEVTINTSIPTPTPPSRPAMAARRHHELLKEIDELDREINEKRARRNRLADFSSINYFEQSMRSKGPMYTAGPSSGEEGYRVGEYARNSDRRNQIDKLDNELARLRDQRDARKEAVRYIYKYD